MSRLVVDWVPWLRQRDGFHAVLLRPNEMNLNFDMYDYDIFMACRAGAFHPAQKKKVVMISGYFNPIHQGHLDLIEEARKFGDWLVALVNNDKQVALKGGCPFQDEHTRLRLVGSLKGVDEARLTIDTDDSVAESLRVLRPQYFYNGGDRTGMNVNKKELAACTDVGCTMVFGGLNSPKVAASSSLIKNAVRWYLLNKPVLLDIEK